MENIRISFLFFFSILISSLVFSQKGKNGDFTISTANTVVNAYTNATVNIPQGASAITVSDNQLTNTILTPRLGAGDLVLIIQMQKVELGNANWTNGENYSGTPNNVMPSEHYFRAEEFGKVTNYFSAGKYEMVEVRGVTGTNTILLACNTQHEYDADGVIQIVRIPRFRKLTFSTSGSVTSTPWNGVFGGVVAMEIEKDLELGNGGSPSIQVNGQGFRGGLADGNQGTADHEPPHGNRIGAGDTYISTMHDSGANKGEGIYGGPSKTAAIFSSKGRSELANGGGGGGTQNAGGGGGSNVGFIGVYTGRGVLPPNYNPTAWAREEQVPGELWSSQSSGGGRGGHVFSQASLDPLTYGPNLEVWRGAKRKENGGLGGQPLAYDPTRVFLGGGGGAGNQDSGQGGSGGNGGGIILVDVYGNVTGNRTISAQGASGQKSNPNNQSYGFSGAARQKGNDGAGGGGGGGAIIIRNFSPLPTGLILDVRGGTGGDFAYTFLVGRPLEICGPGAGGQGGMISVSNGAPNAIISGGTPGNALVSGSIPNYMQAMPTNGATSGGLGLVTANLPFFDLLVRDTTICGGASQSIVLTATLIGNVPAGTVINWYDTQTSNVVLGTGNQFTTPVVSGNRTFWVGVCPGTFRKPVQISISPAPVINGTAVITHPTCTNGGTITGLTVTGGTPAYTYSWSNGVTTLPITNIQAGSYTLTVTDSKGCSATSGPHVLNSSGAPVLVTAPTILPQDCNGNGSLTGMNVSSSAAITEIKMNGTVVLSYDQSVPAGSYTFEVIDANGCTGTFGPYVVVASAVPFIAGTPEVTNANCNTPGSITGLTVSNGQAPYVYSWNGTVTPTAELFTSTAGAYTLVVTDANGCTVNTGPYTIMMDSAPTISGTPIVTNPNCLTGGSVSGLTVTGGSAPLTYMWNNVSSPTANLANATAGSYTLEVRDANGCTAVSGPHVLIAPNMPVISGTAVITPVTCNGPGTISGLTLSGGTAPFIMLYNTTAVTTPDFSTNTAGTYTLNVVDANNCTVQSGPHIITQTNVPSIATPTVVSHQTCNQLGQVTHDTATGGVAPYTYLWSDNVTTTATANVPAGSYSVTVTDAIGCRVTSSAVTVNSVSVPVLDETAAVKTNITCVNQGSVTGITVNGGVAPLVYTWNTVVTTNIDLTGATPGSYTLTVTDANGCAASSNAYNFVAPSIPVLAAPPTIVPVTCAANGSIRSVNITDGLAPYTVTWNGQVSTAPYDLVITTPGVYTLEVTDANQCVLTETFTIAGPDRPGITGAATVTDATCNTLGSVIGFSASGGTLPYTYSWNGDVTPTADLTNAPAGIYTLTVTDANGCTAITPAITIQAIGIPVVGGTPTIVQPTCVFGGEISGFTIAGGQAPYTYSWTNTTQTTINVLGLEPGSYVLTVTDANGCTANSTALQLNEPQNPTIGGTINIDPASCTQNGAIHGIVVNNGLAPYTYNWDGQTSQTLNNNNAAAGLHTLIVTDANGCTATQQYTVTALPGSTVAIQYTPEPAVINEVTTFSAHSNAHLNGYQWQINGQTYSTGMPTLDSLFTEETAVEVIVFAVDDNGCPVTDTIQVVIFGGLKIPNVITPNGDGVNDFFYLGPVLPNTRLTILDRWGSVIYQTDEYKNEWNGRDRRGNLVMDGVYTYLIQTHKGEQFHGFIHVVDSQR